MPGLGTVINAAAIAAGGILGSICGGRLKERYRQTLNAACGVSVIFIGISGVMKYMLGLDKNSPSGGGTMLIVMSLVLGGLLGELLNIEGLFERLGEWLKEKSGSSGDSGFVNGFITASFTVCIGAMAVVGSIQDGLSGDLSVLCAKSVLDFIIIMVMTCSLGKGCIFASVPVLIFEGSITCLAVFIKPIMTDAALAYLSLIGSVLIFCVGINITFGKKINVANLLPSVVIAAAAAFLPFFR